MGAIQQVLAAVGAAPKVYATWDPVNTGSAVTLSNGNLTASANYTGTDNHCMRATIGKTSGIWYWELTFSVAAPSGILPTLGVCRAASSITTIDYLGLDAFSWGYYGSNGRLYNNGGSAAFGATYPVLTVLGFVLDAGARTVEILKDDVSQGSFTVTGTDAIYPAGLQSGTVVANFGASTFAYPSRPALAGANAGIFN